MVLLTGTRAPEILRDGQDEGMREMLSLEELQKYRSETICKDAVIWMHGNQYSRSARSRHLD